MAKYSDEILSIINMSTEHLTAEQIFNKMKKNSSKVVMATVYNNLNAMTDKGLIRRIYVSGEPEHYDKIVRHDHLICSRCGRIRDVYMQDMSGMFKDKSGVNFDTYDLQLLYVCSECKEKDSKMLVEKEGGV